MKKLLNVCPKCGKNSFIKVPHSRIMKESWGILLYVADEYNYRCLDKQCRYETERVKINTKLGDYFALPWYKRIFKL